MQFNLIGSEYPLLPPAAVEDPQPASDLLHLPDEVLLNIFRQLSSADARKIRPACRRINRLVSEPLSESVLFERFTLMGNAAQLIERLRPQPSVSWGGMQVRVIKSANVALPPQAEFDAADRMYEKLQSFQNYLLYLRIHSESRPKASESLLRVKIMIMNLIDGTVDTMTSLKIVKRAGRIERVSQGIFKGVFNNPEGLFSNHANLLRP